MDRCFQMGKFMAIRTLCSYHKATSIPFLEPVNIGGGFEISIVKEKQSISLESNINDTFVKE